MEVVHHSLGKSLRLSRLVNPVSGRTFVVPLDHSVADGPVASAAAFRDIAFAVARNGGDALLVHKGRIRFLPSEVLRGTALVVHLNGITRHAPDADAKVRLAEVEEALELGADAVSIHINMGSGTEGKQLGDLARAAEGCSRWGLPLIAMVYPRGPRITDPTDPELVAHAANLAADLGADIAKVPYTGSPATMAEVVRSCPIGIITAGGAPVGDRQLARTVGEVVASGALGVAMGRNVWASPDVAATVRRIADALHVPAIGRVGAGTPDPGPSYAAEVLSASAAASAQI
ncbi:2-amino-3,7-dideoxy-D-threo-hept-6-ulosonate synthase [Streptomyces rubradiris]|uniref:Fructose-bisphosphate aldolase n=1 Tax=Streptomyces rubradiris TaxID=285531 RepID=A0ABQ3RQQ9_STRRR|nr:2-amino-3,7-dideoxy-D-threo-hept-6-ulosonate synthase [Streptomyces rubradiris]GHH24953.1 fructose-bisphosphate aldolase [Streptomyces rubradiris]GHI58193.1 fructose-bisphosphate aldolase [Streptomyces rubradiris]